MLDRTGAMLLAMNGAARALFRGRPLPELPCPLASLLGDAAARSLIPLLHTSPEELATTVPVPLLDRAVTLLPAPAPDDDGWLVTLEPQVRDWRADLEAILDVLPIGVSIYGTDGRAVFENRESSNLFGYAQDEFQDLEDWWPAGYPDPAYRTLARRAWYDASAQARATGRPVLMDDWRVTCKDGQEKTMQFRFSAVGPNDVCVYWDMTEQRRLEAELRELADTDTLTGLLNRRRFFECAGDLAQASERNGSTLSLLMLDLDHFKAVNDRHGHAIGDQVLQAVADCCRSLLRENDLLARLGGEEFAVLLPHTSRPQAMAVAERLRVGIAEHRFLFGREPLDLHLSIGGATGQPGYNPIGKLLERADRSLYAAKRAGRNCVRFEP